MTSNETQAKMVRNGILVLWALVCLIPILWEISISIRPRTETMVNPPVYIPTFTLNAWYDTFINWPTLYYLRNSLIGGIGSVLLELLLGIPAAYSLARFKYPGRDQIAFYILTTWMLIPVAVAIPLFMLMRTINLLDSPLALILLYAALNLALVIWILRSFFMQIPKEITEAARLDGLGELGIMWKIIIPMSLPGILTASILALIFAINEFLFTLMISYTKSAQTLSVGLAMFTGGQKGIIYPNIAVIAIVTFIPVFILTLLIQRHLSRGLSFGLLKG